MFVKSKKALRTLEIALIVNVVGLTCLLYVSTGYKMTELNLFCLPVVLAGFFLGRYRAGVLALFCVISASLVSVFDLMNFAPLTSPVTVFLAVTIWGAVLGLCTILVGTLSGERTARTQELHEAHMGLVDVLSRYLNPSLLERSRPVSKMSQQVAAEMKLSERETDNIRVAALLQDMENLEITAKVLKKAVGELGKGDQQFWKPHTFQGAELVHSLGSLLTGALPLLLYQNDPLKLEGPASNASEHLMDVPFGACIIESVRTYETLTNGNDRPTGDSYRTAIAELCLDVEADHHPAVLDALERALENSAEVPKPSPIKSVKSAHFASVGV